LQVGGYHHPKRGRRDVVDEERIVFVLSTLHKDLFHPKKGVADITLNNFSTIKTPN
jgi:hypothetical protein